MTHPVITTPKKTSGSGSVFQPRRIAALLRTASGRQELRQLISLRIDRPPAVTHFNEAVNPERGLIYVAVPKTGSSTIRDQVSPLPHLDRRYLLRTPHLDLVQIKQGMIYFAQTQALDSNRSFPHTVGSTADVTAAALAAFDTSFKFSVVRNPWARAVSLYFRKEGVQVADQISFADFIERHTEASDTCRSSTLHRNQADWLSDESGTLAMDYVLRIEDLADKVDELAERSGGQVKLGTELRSNANARSRSGSYRDLYDDRLKTLVAQRFEKDIDLFKYTF